MPCAAGCVRTPAARELRKQPCCDGRCGSARRRRGLRGQAGVRASAGPPPDARNLFASDIIIWKKKKRGWAGESMRENKKGAAKKRCATGVGCGCAAVRRAHGNGESHCLANDPLPHVRHGGLPRHQPGAARRARAAQRAQPRGAAGAAARARAALRCDALCDAALPQAHARGLSLTPAGACAALAGPLSYACLRLGASVGSAFAFAFAGGGDGGV